ncbi:hypothetical protein AWC38_SpisGene7519 [Stylophora pistillata]|uniref:Uncharacterized protein n=1 Tax=Stylophora pistillata TaxID=50429 RepID=A0A2B4SD02_STYPI|nr:hypothetical protein AWC38_SpisGene7519 [Stylophora pistillata]
MADSIPTSLRLQTKLMADKFPEDACKRRQSALGVDIEEEDIPLQPKRKANECKEKKNKKIKGLQSDEDDDDGSDNTFQGGGLFDVGNSHSIGEMVLKGLANSGAYVSGQGAAKAIKSDYAKKKIKQTANKYLDQALDSFTNDLSKKISAGNIDYSQCNSS